MYPGIYNSWGNWDHMLNYISGSRKTKEYVSFTTCIDQEFWKWPINMTKICEKIRTYWISNGKEKRALKRRLHIQFVKRFGILFAPNIVPLWSKKIGKKNLPRIFNFIKRQYLSQINFQIVKQIGCVDAASRGNFRVYSRQK